jgi:CheY-like chemotaxis protein
MYSRSGAHQYVNMTQHPLRVLVVDDSPDDAELIGRALSRGGFAAECVRVDTPTTVAAALKACERWDVVACDVRMPHLDAARVLAETHAAIPGVPIVVVAGAYPQELWHELGSGMVRSFISKDRLDTLPSTVRTLLQSAKARIHSSG